MVSALLTPSLSSGSVTNGKKSPRLHYQASVRLVPKSNLNRLKVKAAIKKKTEENKAESKLSSVEETTQKFGLEAGLWKIFSAKNEGNQGGNSGQSKRDEAKQLLAKYGGAYLATSLAISLISFSFFYALISAGVDVQELMHKVGITTDGTTEKLGTFALAYAAHKVASPIRFPPRVALTPIVASWIGKITKINNPAIRYVDLPPVLSAFSGSL